MMVLFVVIDAQGRVSLGQLAVLAQFVELLRDLRDLKGELPPEGNVHLRVQDVQQGREHARSPLHHGGGSFMVQFPPQQGPVHLRQLLQYPDVVCDIPVDHIILQRLELVVVRQLEHLPPGLEREPCARGRGLANHLRLPLVRLLPLRLHKRQRFGERVGPRGDKACIGTAYPPLHHLVQPPEVHRKPYFLPGRILQPAHSSLLASVVATIFLLDLGLVPGLLCQSIVLRLLVLQVDDLWEDRVPDDGF
mmetsp:Transcript_78031/g.203224  ORF Transcript_78031/g.203224 Transcript_78031/m.203224 type:complete len:249 (-) Transcript_78031:315-1061(-)